MWGEAYCTRSREKNEMQRNIRLANMFLCSLHFCAIVWPSYQKPCIRSARYEYMYCCYYTFILFGVLHMPSQLIVPEISLHLHNFCIIIFAFRNGFLIANTPKICSHIVKVSNDFVSYIVMYCCIDYIVFIYHLCFKLFSLYLSKLLLVWQCKCTIIFKTNKTNLKLLICQNVFSLIVQFFVPTYASFLGLMKLSGFCCNSCFTVVVC